MQENPKLRILELIQENAPVFKSSSLYQYSIRCPICGDSQKKLTDTHCYLKCSPDPTEPILYHCFKCNASGLVNSNFLSRMGIESKVDDLFITTHRKLPKVTAENVNVMTGDVNMDSDQVGYIEYRLGSGFTEEDYDRFKIVWNSSNLIPFISSDRIRHTLPSNDSSISFLSDTRATMLTRFFNSNGGMRWKNINLYPSGGKAFYTIKSSIDLFYTGNTVVNVAEGIFDLLSVYKNFNSGENSIYLAILGKDYTDAIDYLVARGIVGSSVVIRMYIDSDINVSEIKKLMRYYKWLFGSIIIVRNSKADDFGVKIENIDPIETRV